MGALVAGVFWGVLWTSSVSVDFLSREVKTTTLQCLETGMVTYGATGRSGRLFLMGSAMVTDLAVMTTRPREICRQGVEEGRRKEEGSDCGLRAWRERFGGLQNAKERVVLVVSSALQEMLREGRKSCQWALLENLRGNWPVRTPHSDGFTNSFLRESY